MEKQAAQQVNISDPNNTLDPIYSTLLNKLSENRDSLDEMIETVCKARKTIQTLFPEKVDFKNKRYFMEERMKAISGIFSIELDIRKQKEQSIKAEIELRRKLSGEGENRTLEELYKDSVALAKALEHLDKGNDSSSTAIQFDGIDKELDMTPALAQAKKG